MRLNRLTRLGWLPFLLALLTASALSMPALAQASTMLLSSRSFPSGALTPDGVSGAVPLKSGASVTETAPKYLYVPGTATTEPSGYEFTFWDANGTLSTTNTVKFTAAAAGKFYARAWYLPMCVPGDTDCGGGGSGAELWAFSLTANRPLKESPIATVTPSTAQTGPDTVATAGGPVTITAALKLGVPPLPAGPLPPYYMFNSLFQFAGNGTVAGQTLTVPSKGASDAIAFYHYVPPFHKPICFPGPPPDCI
jgi:hypothetical protein